MNPVHFSINEDVVAQVLGTIVLLSILIERALSVVFEWRPVLALITSRNLKEPIAVVVSLVAVHLYGFDAPAIIFSQDHNTLAGYLITAAIVAGGSKGSIKLFRHALGWKSSAQHEHEQAKLTAPARIPAQSKLV